MYAWRSPTAFSVMWNCEQSDNTDRQIWSTKGICLCRVCWDWCCSECSPVKWIRIAWSTTQGLYYQIIHVNSISQSMFLWLYLKSGFPFRCPLSVQMFLEWSSTMEEDLWVSDQGGLSCLHRSIHHMVTGKQLFRNWRKWKLILDLMLLSSVSAMHYVNFDVNILFDWNGALLWCSAHRKT